MDNRANHQEKHPNCATTAIWLCEDREYLAAYICNSCYPETSVGEVVSPKSTLKHLFGTGKDNQNLKGGNLNDICDRNVDARYS
jgi:hypothetical protein